MGIFCSKCKDNEIDLLKDENYPQIENLPNEIMVDIFSYLNKNEIMKISMVNKRWFQVGNNEIANLSIEWPKQDNQDLQNLINRFPRLKNLELATIITNKNLDHLPLEFFEFDGTLEFDICQNLIPTNNWEEDNPSTFITRIRINPTKEKDFEYKKSQIINFEIAMPRPQDFDSVLEEILSLVNVSKITFSAIILEGFNQQECINFVKIMESIFSRPALKQIDFALLFNVDLDFETKFPKNFNVEEITFAMNSLNHHLQYPVFDALPNIKKITVFATDDLKNLPATLKNISVLKHLESIHVGICSRYEDEKFDAQKFRDCREIRDCCDIIKDNFPMKAEVVIADLAVLDILNDDIYGDDLTNLIKKEEGKEPEIVIGTSWFSRFFDRDVASSKNLEAPVLIRQAKAAPPWS